jgi:hypothetical protein
MEKKLVDDKKRNDRSNKTHSVAELFKKQLARNENDNKNVMTVTVNNTTQRDSIFNNTETLTGESCVTGEYLYTKLDFLNCHFPPQILFLWRVFKRIIMMTLTYQAIILTPTLIVKNLLNYMNMVT